MPTFAEEPKTTRGRTAAASMIARSATRRTPRAGGGVALIAGLLPSSNITNQALQRALEDERAVQHAQHAPVQAKLTINKPGDVYEQEADSMAERVMRMTALPDHGGEGASEEKMSEGVVGDTTMAEGIVAENEHAPLVPVMTKSLEEHGAGGIEAPPIVHQALNSSGQPLDRATRGFMEPRFGWDFSAVRVHTDAGGPSWRRERSARGRSPATVTSSSGPGSMRPASLLDRIDIVSIIEGEVLTPPTFTDEPRRTRLSPAGALTGCGSIGGDALTPPRPPAPSAPGASATSAPPAAASSTRRAS